MVMGLEQFVYILANLSCFSLTQIMFWCKSTKTVYCGTVLFWLVEINSTNQKIDWPLFNNMEDILPWFSNRRDTQISVYIMMCLQKRTFRDTQCNFWPGFNVHVQPGRCFLQSPFSCETANIWNLHHFVSRFLSQVYLGFLKIKINLVKLTFWTAISGNESHKSVGYGTYTCTTLNIVLFLQLIGWKQKKVGGSWANHQYNQFLIWNGKKPRCIKVVPNPEIYAKRPSEQEWRMVAKCKVQLFLFISVLWMFVVGTESMDLVNDKVFLQEPYVTYPFEVNLSSIYELKA